MITLLLFVGISLPAQGLVVLQYHHISEDTPKSTSISPKLFAQHMQWLKDHDYTIASIEQLAHWLKESEPLPDKTVVITFDDGYTSIYDEAWPILKKNNWPFTVFINTQHHDEKNKQYMSWQQLRKLVKGGATIGNHSVSHSHMIRMGAKETEKQWRARASDEVFAAQKIIDQNLGKQPKVFAYPYGEYNRALEGILQQQDYLAFGQQSGPIAPFDSLTALPRFPFGGNFGAIDDFKVKVRSLAMPLEQVQLVDEGGRILLEPLLPAGVDRPTLTLTGAKELLARVQCFAGANEVKTHLEGEQLQVQVEKPFGVGRSRYNCTAPTANGFYWYSRLVMNKYPDGRWYEE